MPPFRDTPHPPKWLKSGHLLSDAFSLAEDNSTGGETGKSIPCNMTYDIMQMVLQKIVVIIIFG